MAKKKIGSKTSKRISCAKRYKIEKKVRQHKKKIKKLNLKVSSKKRSKKDPGVPNSCPFKEEILREADSRKQRTEEERVRRADKRKAERAKLVGKKRSLEGVGKDATKRGDGLQNKVEQSKKKEKQLDKGGTKRGGVEGSRKAYYREVKKVIEGADVVLEVLDARDPLGSRCPQLEQAVLEAGPAKRIVLLLNKIDLVPRDNVEAWLKYLRNEFPTVAFKASTQSQTHRLSQSRVPFSFASEAELSSSGCVGADALMRLLANYCRSQDLRTAITVGVVGFPNTGKSSVINSLKRAKACRVGATPGITTSLQVVQLDKLIKLIDSPGVVMETNRTDASIVLRNSVRLESLEDPIPAVSIILSRCDKHQLMVQYSVAEFSTVEEFLALLAARRGQLRKGGLPLVNRAAKDIIRDWNTGKIAYYTSPPEVYSRSSHISAEIVSAMSRAFNMSALLDEERESLQGLKRTGSVEVVLPSPGLTAGSLDGREAGGKEAEDSDWSDVSDSDEGGEERMDDDSSATVAKPSKGIKSSVTKKVSFAAKLKSTGGAEGTAPKEMAPSSEQGTTPKGKAPNRVQGVPPKVKPVLPGNAQTNKERKKEFRKLQRQRKRDGLSAGQPSVSESNTGQTKMAITEDYDFNTDFS